MHAGGSGVRLYDGPDINLFILVGVAGVSRLLLGPPVFNWCFPFAPELVSYLAPKDLHRIFLIIYLKNMFLTNYFVKNLAPSHFDADESILFVYNGVHKTVLDPLYHYNFDSSVCFVLSFLSVIISKFGSM